MTWKLLMATREPVSLEGSPDVLWALPLAWLGMPGDGSIVVREHEVDWSRWEESARTRALGDDGVYEREGESWAEEGLTLRWIPHELPHPPHLSFERVPQVIAAGRDETRVLRRLETRSAEPTDEASLEALEDADEEERARTVFWSSRIGAPLAFSQATLRALSRATGALLEPLAQIRPDVAYDRYGYTIYVFGDRATGELSLTYQR